MIREWRSYREAVKAAGAELAVAEEAVEVTRPKADLTPEGNSNKVSTMTNKTGKGGTKTNSKGEPHCFYCGATSHWAYECPQLSGEQQAQLHMKLNSQEDEQAQEQAGEEGHQMLHVSMAKGAICLTTERTWTGVPR
jgi:hypothetical protein